MKNSPLQLDVPEYPVIEVRAYPHEDEETLLSELPVKVNCYTTYREAGDHFSMVSLRQPDKKYAYTFDVRVFVSFKLDVAICKDTYKSAFNPAVVAVNVARILYSGAREMLATVSCRAPHGPVKLPSIMLEPQDVTIEFEDEKQDYILREYFCFSDSMLSELNAAMAAQKSKETRGKSKSPTKKSKTRDRESATTKG